MTDQASGCVRCLKTAILHTSGTGKNKRSDCKQDSSDDDRAHISRFLAFRKCHLREKAIHHWWQKNRLPYTTKKVGELFFRPAIAGRASLRINLDILVACAF